MATIVVDQKETQMRGQDSYPHTSKHLMETLNKIRNRGLNQQQVATFMRIYGKDCFKAPKAGETGQGRGYAVELGGCVLPKSS